LQCCNPESNGNGGGGWGVFNAILGWTNSATYGSVISYNLYWIVVMIGFFSMRYQEVKGHWPLMKAKNRPEADTLSHQSESEISAVEGGKTVVTEKSAEIAV
jgi:high-affinity iron transporter